MKKRLLTLLFLPLLGFSQTSKRTITGQINDARTNKPVAFCNVMQLNTSRGTQADINGRFEIELPEKENDFLIFQSLGYEADTIVVTSRRNEYQVYLTAQTAELDEVAVTATTRATFLKEHPMPIATVSTKQIEHSSESNVLDALVKNVPGLQAVKTGPNISKPFIRGLGYNRILTLYNGLRQEGQQYGDEHGIEVDDYNVARAEVIKGPASLLYGSDAIAGVLSLFPYIPTRNDGGWHGKAISEYHTNNNLIGNGFGIDYASNRLVFTVNGSYRVAKNYRNPIDGRVYLTNFSQKNVSAIAGHQSTNGFTQLHMTLYDNHQGIPDGSRDSLTRKFTKQLLDEDDDILDRPVVPDSELNSYAVPDLSQRIRHYRIFLHSFYHLGKGDVDVLVGMQQNFRQEFTHPEFPSLPGMSMKLNTLNYSLKYNAPRFLNVETSLGVNGMVQKNKNKKATEFPIPDYHLHDVGAYLYAKWKKRKWSVSGGLRYDLRGVQWDDFFVGIPPGSNFEQQSDAGDPTAELQFENFQKRFKGASGSVGVAFQISKRLGMKANIGKGYRAPTVTELGSNGLDPGARIIYLGDRDFQPEFSLQQDLGLRLSGTDFSGEISLFHNYIQNFIYHSAIADSLGSPVVDAQGNQTHQYAHSQARLYGMEVWLSLHPTKIKGFRWESSLSSVYGSAKRQDAAHADFSDSDYLPFMPPMTIRSAISIEQNIHSKPVSFRPKIEVEHAARQNRYLALNGTETATPAYTLWNVGLWSELRYLEGKTILLSFQVNNLWNKAYQSHLNRLKYFEYYPSSSSGHRGIYNMGRNVVLKAVVSF